MGGGVWRDEGAREGGMERGGSGREVMGGEGNGKAGGPGALNTSLAVSLWLWSTAKMDRH